MLRAGVARGMVIVHLPSPCYHDIYLLYPLYDHAICITFSIVITLSIPSCHVCSVHSIHFPLHALLSLCITVMAYLLVQLFGSCGWQSWRLLSTTCHAMKVVPKLVIRAFCLQHNESIATSDTWLHLYLHLNIHCYSSDSTSLCLFCAK